MRKFVACAAILCIVVLGWAVVSVSARDPRHPLAQELEASIDSPLPNTQVQGRVQVKGSALHPQFSFYKVEVGPGENPTDDQMTIIGAIHEEQIKDGLLETWDTTLFPDGTYTLRLRVVDITGNYQESWVRRLSVNNTMLLPTATPTPFAATPTFTPGIPTATPTSIPPTPTIVVEQPFLEIPTATPSPTTGFIAAGSPTAEAVGPALTTTPSPEPTESFGAVLSKTVQPQKLGNAMCLGAGLMGGLFLIMGMLSGLRRVVLYVLSQHPGQFNR